MKFIPTVQLSRYLYMHKITPQSPPIPEHLHHSKISPHAQERSLSICLSPHPQFLAPTIWLSASVDLPILDSLNMWLKPL